MSANENYSARRMNAILNERFDLEEIRELCFQLGVKFDDLKGEGLKAKILDLVQRFERNDKLRELAEAVQTAQPDLTLIPLDEDKHPGQQTKQIFTLFISAQHEDRLSSILSRLPVFSRLLPDMRVPVALAPGDGIAAVQAGADKLLRRDAEGGIVLATFDQPEALLQCALNVAVEMKRRGDAACCMGMYSDLVRVAPGDAEQEIPAESVSLARRIMLLGDNGHILASRQAAEYFERSPELAQKFHRLGKYEVKPGVRVEVHNVYTPEVGNPGRPTSKVPEQSLVHVSVPRELRCSRAGTIKLTFAPDLPFVKVEFKVKNENIQITCNGQAEDEPVFKIDFTSSDTSRQQTFEIGAREVEKESLELVRISCYDERDELLSPPVHRWVRLIPSVKAPDKFYDVVRLILWLWDRFTCWPLLARLAVVAGVVVAGIVFTPPSVKKQISEAKESAFISLGIWPDVKDAWEDEFEYDSPSATTWRNSGNWSYPVNSWVPAPGVTQGSVAADGAVTVKGDGIGVYKGLAAEKTAFYDFDLDFQIKFLKGDTARWIIRADPEGQSWYEFELINGQGQLFLRAYAVSPGKPRRELENGNQPINVPECCGPNESFRVVAQVNKFEFRHTLALLPAGEDDDREILGEQIETKVIRDKERAFRYGNVGLLGRGDGNEIQVYFWRVTRPQAPGTPAN